MAIEAGTFETLIPSRYISFYLPIFSIPNPPDYFFAKDLQISVLDSPAQPIDAPKVAAMLIPKGREKDWIFTTEAGHLQLLLSSPRISRLILIGNAPNCDEYATKTYRKLAEKDPCSREKIEISLYPLLMALLPKEIATNVDNFEVPFLSYEDNVISSVILEKCVGPYVGEMLIEDVEIEGPERGFRRRLRFKRMPNLIQTEIRLGKAGFCLDLQVLVHPYLAPMVAGLSLVSGFIQEKFESGFRPRSCCIGAGGGALLNFLSAQLGFEVVGVEVDEVVLRVAKQYFGLETGKGIQLHVGDGIEILRKKKFDVFHSTFDVVMVDVDSSDPKVGISAPAMEFMHKDVLLAVKSSLSGHGILVLNVIPPNRSFYDMLIHVLREVFIDLHEIDCGNEENFVLIASMSSIGCEPGMSGNAFLKKLKSVISEAFIDSIRKI